MGSLNIGLASFSSLTLPLPDFLLSFGDAQGNFLAVKVSNAQLARPRHPKLDIYIRKKAYGYTDLLSCMLLDA